MDLQTRKIEFIQEFLKLESEELIFQLEHLLKKNSSKKASVLKPLTKKELNARIDKAEQDFASGKFVSSKKLLEKYK
jgi:hypothetical protein